MKYTFSLIVVTSLLLVSPSYGQAYDSPKNLWGQPDLQGIWQATNSINYDIQDHEARMGVPAGYGVVIGNDLSYRSQASNQRRVNYDNRETLDPEGKCFMTGVPRSNYMPYPFEIMQTQDQIVLTYEYVHSIRNIYLNSEHPGISEIEWYMGDSRAQWDGDTLVVDVVNLGGNWLDRSGNFYGAGAHIVERYTLIDQDHMNYHVTIDDPNTFFETVEMEMTLYRRVEEGLRLMEYECNTFFGDEAPDALRR
jgi:hypothetical protein